MTRHDAFRLTCGLLGFSALACGTQHMQVPAEIAQRSEVLVATDRSSWSGSLANENFQLGPYAVQDVDRDWDSSSGIAVANVAHKSTGGGYAYKLASKGTTETGHCITVDKETAIGLGSGFGLEFQFAKLICSCDGMHKQATVMVESSDGKFAGSVATSQSNYALKSVHELEGGSTQSKPTGYRMDGESGVGAAEVTHPGRVWIDKKLSEGERAEVACLFVGLMLYKPKEDK